MTSKLSISACLLLVALLLGACSDSQPAGENGSGADEWVAVWGTANYTTYPNGPLSDAVPVPSNTSFFVDQRAQDQSFRMMIRPTAAGQQLRFQFSNVFGEQPLALSAANVALRAAPVVAAIDADSVTPITFAGMASVVIAPGDEIVSDAVEFSYAFGDDLAISFHVAGASGLMSWHAEAFAVQFASLPNSGDVTEDSTGLNFLSVDRGWFFLSGVDASATATDSSAPSSPQFSIVAFGDSITDGAFGTLELNHRWPDFFAARLQEQGIPASVVNAGINSNTVLDNDDPVTRGVAGTQRFGRDVLDRSGVRSVVVLLGTNDIAADGRSADEVFDGLLDLAGQAHAAGVCIMVSTILPRNDPPVPFGWNALVHEPVRQALNQRILDSEDFDATVDLASAMANPLLPNQPNQLLFVEGLHPNSLGMFVLADAIPMEPLLPPPAGDCVR